MPSSRSLQCWTTIAALFMMTGSIALPGSPAAAAVAAEALLQPTPLVLKDGRIAKVSIHVLPFDNGAGELAANAASRLAELTAAVATDCFLTAQVIGHVSSREVADNETLAAHRLARARADAVQASLIGGGLPAKAIASVWDWQFLVREPRATLWVFRLVQGEDCEGQPLEGSAGQLIAQADVPETVSPQAERPAEAAPARQVTAQPTASPPPAQVSTAATAVQVEADQAPAGPDLAGMVGSALAAESPQAAGPAARPTALQEQRPAAREGSSTAAAASEPAERTPAASSTADAVPTLTRPLPALSPSGPGEGRLDRDRAGERSVAAVAPRPEGSNAAQQASGGGAQPPAHRQAAAPRDPEREGKVEWGPDNVVITFATNSSYFPPGTARRLSALLGSMTAGERYRIGLEVGVSGSDTVVGASSPEEARRYNRWLAERRMGRVREWFDEHAGERELEIEPVFQANDDSRRVVVRIAPAS